MTNTQINHFSKANKLYKENKFSEALAEYLLIEKKYAASKAILSTVKYSINRLLVKTEKQASNLDLGIQALYETPNTPVNYVYDEKSPKPLISLTAISTRIERVAITIRSIKKQTLQPHSINLYISQDSYLVDEGIQANCGHLKEIFSLGVNIYNVKNIGPYRKQYPIIEQLKSAGADPKTPIVTIDDDVIYPKEIIKSLVETMSEKNAIVAHRGREISVTENAIADYSEFPIPSQYSSLNNVGTGKNGIAYQLGFFPASKKNYIGHILAPTADDIWCKWASTVYCVPTIILEPNAAYDASLDFEETAPEDKRGLFHNYNARGTNDIAINNMESYFSFATTGIYPLIKGFKNV